MILLTATMRLLYFLCCFFFSYHAVAQPVLPESLVIPVQYVQRFQTLVQTKPSNLQYLLSTAKRYPAPLLKRGLSLQYVEFPRSSFDGPIDLSLTTVNGRVNFQLAEFNQSVEIAQAKFLGNVNFNWTIFHETFNGMYTKFYKMASFYNAKFNGLVDCFAVSFAGFANFQHAVFLNRVDFSNVIFNQNAIFDQTQFERRVTFANAEFLKSAYFEGAIFKRKVIFIRTKFSDVVSFARSEFWGDVVLYAVTLPKFLDFSNADIKNSIDLTAALPNPSGKRTRINLIQADISKIKLRYSMFKLVFPKNTPRLDIDFTYHALIANLNQNGFRDDYYLASIEFAEYQYLRDSHYILNFIEKYWWAYGFDRARIFWWILILIVIFTLVNDLFYEWLMTHAFEVPFLQSFVANSTVKRSWLARHVHNLPYALLYTTYIFFGGLIGFSRGAEKFKSKNYFVNLYLISIIILGLICTFFVLKSL